MTYPVYEGVLFTGLNSPRSFPPYPVNCTGNIHQPVVLKLPDALVHGDERAGTTCAGTEAETTEVRYQGLTRNKILLIKE